MEASHNTHRPHMKVGKDEEKKISESATPLFRCRQREHDCLFDEGLTFCLQQVLTTVVQSLTAVAGNSVFLQHSIGGAT